MSSTELDFSGVWWEHEQHVDDTCGDDLDTLLGHFIYPRLLGGFFVARSLVFYVAS